ncbi:hypothetical protein LCGC14_2346120 [marine sediment metagenome]|uniref:Uncharacterized protein n=1 Tax=marine sediment metagenome TaxID=412755 RepID=A0A0F9CY41_9ZZZZ
MVSGESSKVGQLIDNFIQQLSEVADDEDWQEADGWVGKWTILGGKEGDISRVYEVRDGRFSPTTPRQVYTGEVIMSQDTFLDIVAAALHGKGEETFAEKYGKRRIRYEGEQWLVDSERFRRVLRRMGRMPRRVL